MLITMTLILLNYSVIKVYNFQLNQLETGDVSVTTFVAVGTGGSLNRATNNTKRLYGADVLITEQLIERLIAHEAVQSGLNLTHSQDKDYVTVSRRFLMFKLLSELQINPCQTRC